MTGYPWTTGDVLLAADLNAAIANSAAYGPFLPVSGGTVDPGPTTFTRTASPAGHVTITPVGMYDTLPGSTSLAQLDSLVNLGQGRGGTYFNPFFTGRFVSSVYGSLDMSAVGLLGQIDFAGLGGVGQHCAVQAYANRYKTIAQPTTTVAATLGAPAITIQVANVSNFQYDSQPVLINGNPYLQIAHSGTSGAGTISVERNVSVADGTAGCVVTGQNNPSLWGFNINVNDNAGGDNINSSRLSNYTIGCELDFSCSGLDNAGPLLFGTPAGIRNMIGMVGFGGTPANPAEIGDGVSIGEGAGSTISWKRGFRMAGRFSQAVFDTRQAVAQGGSAHAVWLADGHTIALDTAGTTTLGASGGRVAFGGTGTGFNGTAPVARPTGWGAPTGTATRTTFATSTVLLPALAEHVKALIDDLTAYGLIGS